MQDQPFNQPTDTGGGTPVGVPTPTSSVPEPTQGEGGTPKPVTPVPEPPTPDQPGAPTQ